MATATDIPVSEGRLDKIRRYVASHIPLVPDGVRIIVDKSAMDRVLLDALEKNPSIGERIKGMVSWVWGARQKTSLTELQIGQLKSMLMEEFNRTSGKPPFDGSVLENETPAPLKRLMMAGPEEHASEHAPEDKEQIFREWFCIRHALVTSRADLEIIPTSDDGGAREVYTRDRYVLINDIAYLPDPQELQNLNDEGELDTPRDEIQWYKGEVAQVKKFLEERGVKTVIVKGAWFEGGNVVRHFSNRTIFVGIDDPWSSENSAEKLIDAINATQRRQWSMMPIPLTNAEKMYHLDTGMSEELPYGEVMISPLVTSKAVYEKIKAVVGRKNLIELNEKDANSLATNVIDVGDTLVMTGDCKKLRRKLARKGYRVILPSDYKQKDFEFGLGGVHCMTNDIPLPRRKVIALRNPIK